ncbi:hypothetical protein IAU60_004078 [Kwoniella sp. DSM 27419]
MSERDGTPPPSTSSSFPLSSPTFWSEAAAVTIPSPPDHKRRLDSSSPGVDDELFSVIDLDHPAKRPRQQSPPTSRTNLSYLPKRSEPIAQDDPHSYLANAEYAPNRFGDIGDYMRKKEIKVQTQNRDIALASAASGLPQIFTGLSFYINGNTHPPMEEIRKMILQRGGEVRPVLRNKGMVKFIIAPMLTQSKFKQFERYKVVREGWIIESCKEGRLLDWTRWKLQIQGGWEEGGRKGMEEFFKSQADATQCDPSTIPKQLSPSPDLPEVNVGDVDNVESKIDLELPVITIPRASAATQPLIAPVRTPAPTTLAQSPLATRPAKTETDGSGPPPLGQSPKAQPPKWMSEFYGAPEPNEHAAKALRNQEWRLRNTAERGNEGGFIDGYYQNSRLHHLSTWKAELKVLVADAQRRSEELSLTTPSSSTIAPFSLANSTLPTTRAMGLTSDGERVIFHVDFDCFFVSCGLATRPHLKGLPVVVCHSQAGKGASSTSEIASCSYEARAKGVKNGMSLGRARTLVGDDLQTIPYEFDTYKKFSLSFYTVLMGYADELQAVSVDEALIDVTSAVNARAMAPEEAAEDGRVSESDVTAGDEFPADDSDDASPHLPLKRKRRDPATEVAEKIRDDVRKLTDGCEVSIGISHNILLAKLATRSAKPAGVAHLLAEDIPTFLAPLDVEDFPSIGYSIKSKIAEKFGTTNVEGLLSVSKVAFQRVLGPKTGEMLFGYLRGVDERKLEPDKARKSVSAEMNYGIRFQNQDQAELCVSDLAVEVSKRMKNVGAKGKQITLKIMRRHPDASVEPPKFLGHGWCETFNRSAPLMGPRGTATDDQTIFSRECVKLLRAMKLDPVELRGVGIQVTKLDTEEKKVEREAGQGRLRFQPKRGVSTAKSENEDTSFVGKVPKAEAADQTIKETPQVRSDAVDLAPSVEKRTQALPVAEVTKEYSEAAPVPAPAARTPSPPPQPGPSRLVDVSPDGIDPSYLAALPPELQDEVKRDFAQTRARTRSRAASENPSGAAGSRTGPAESTPSQRAVTISPVKRTGMHEAAHITRQLRPKVKTQLRAAQLADQPLFHAWTRAQDRATSEVVDLTGGEGGSSPGPEIGGYRLAELKELDIDPDVFAALPEEMRAEVIGEERNKAGRRAVLHRPGSHSTRAGSRARTGVSASVSPSKSARAGSVPPGPGRPQVNRPAITISRVVKPTLFKSTELSDIYKIIETWIESRKGSGPAEKDASKVRSFLLKSVESGLGGVETSVEVIKWMRVLLREKWPDEEWTSEGDMPPEEDPDGIKAGRAWWQTWRGFRRGVDDLAERKFGASLRM